MKYKFNDAYLHRGSIALLIWGVLILGSCDTSFDPFEDSDRNYSVFGYLDAGVDTQYVRVSPLRDSIGLAPKPIDAMVMIEETESGEQFIFQDSIFLFNEGRVAINYWAGVSVDYEATYLLSVVRSDGARSTAMVSMPPNFPNPDLVVPIPGIGQDPREMVQGIRVEGVERLADLRVTYRLALPGGEAEPFFHTEPYLLTTGESQSGFLAAFNAYDDLIDHFDNCPLVFESTAFVAAAGPDWPDLDGIDLETLARPDVITNIENGVGYLGGVASKTIEWEALTAFLFTRYSLCLQGLR